MLPRYNLAYLALTTANFECAMRNPESHCFIRQISAPSILIRSSRWLSVRWARTRNLRKPYDARTLGTAQTAV